jgi:signal transduction histidine kinase
MTHDRALTRKSFATKSDQKGTSLELFKSKNIIEAHGGKWAENNPN